MIKKKNLTKVSNTSDIRFKMIIYKITNLINNKAYIGLTTQSINVRFSQHKHHSKNGSSMLIHTAIKKYGIDNFKIEKIDQANKIEELVAQEFWHSMLENTIAPNGYNIKPGGQLGGNGGTNKGVKWSEDKKTAHKTAMKNRELIPWNKGLKGTMKANSGSFRTETASGKKNKFFGKKHSEATKLLISKNNGVSLNVFDSKNKKQWNSIKECWLENREILNSYSNFADQLRGRCKNKTGFILRKVKEI